MTDAAEAELEAALREGTPIIGGPHALELVPRDVGDESRLAWIERGFARVTLRMITWDGPRDQPARSILDIREQEIVIAPGDTRDEPPGRLREYILGWADAVAECLERVPDGACLMPVDLVFPRVFELKRPRTREQFTGALLVRSRMGRWMSEET